ncbi:unnamed protein product [Didymodactylos carnosus]|uniref:B box-type domain-containing protein n=1 Tax=Didymodactylos carnosus TaxID=1234261 RepID=A0A814A067_9BILA|nr:unnamed protein product [Didymodactylos carnosus]CAF1170472.1 unnamed protein product [Didymodactylos carnosus]CAF3687547.1 unnamed protein product [Didymodactylos carnosus]CAF3981820.1 unnamed protein product [Didymodactylos carnosus]
MPNPSKIPCRKCVKNTGILTCEGCSNKLCGKCFNEHRQELSKELDNVVYEHDTLKQQLETTNQLSSHPLFKQIDQWQKDAIDKINTLAEHSRNAVEKVLNDNKVELINRVQTITDELRKGRNDEDYVETDLEEWLEQLKQLQQQLVKPSNISLIEEKQTSWINKINIINSNRKTSEKLEKTCGDVSTEENGQVAVHGSSATHAEIRGANMYSTGNIQIKMKIEKLFINDWMFVGIVSSSLPMKSSPINSTSAFGWIIGKNNFCVNNKKINSFGVWDADIQENDIIELHINCDKKKVQLSNYHTNKRDEIYVDISICPFPWQLHFNIHGSGDRVRLLKE